MNIRACKYSTTPASGQDGAALLTALIFLVALTLVGIGVYSVTTSDEKMARNFRDKEIAMQAAEAALNEAKILITASYNSASAPTTIPTPLSEEKCYSNTPSGYSCDLTIDANTADLFDSSTSAGTASAALSSVGSSLSPSITGLYTQPKYLVIWQKAAICGSSNTSYCFQIIAQAKGRLSNTRVNVAELFTY